MIQAHGVYSIGRAKQTGTTACCNTPVLIGISSNCIDVPALNQWYWRNDSTSCNLLLLVGCAEDKRCSSLTTFLGSVESLFYEFLQPGTMTASLIARRGFPLASFYLLSQQTSLSFFTCPTDGHSGSNLHSSSYGTYPT